MPYENVQCDALSKLHHYVAFIGFLEQLEDCWYLVAVDLSQNIEFLCTADIVVTLSLLEHFDSQLAVLLLLGRAGIDSAVIPLQ